ncbi:metallophosphoesterase [Bartonella sp. F02]|uniref:metallophosphoesterase n=1 Tax=Bartonella sp. F02 TaxID=2967262 RepID=UPI0022A90C72|nr:metallophosphoesterase [Bartonella sp. F02]MCZ2328976.1 metallophosphoesterase [Bartonella sp. F02]
MKYIGISIIALALSGCLTPDSESTKRNSQSHDISSKNLSLTRRHSVKNYTAIIMADPQAWRLNSGDPNGETNRNPWIQINRKVARTIKSHKAAFHIINGDLTEFGQLKNYIDYRNIYKNIGSPVYEGLGNHDYANNVGNCEIPEEFNSSKNACAISAVKRMLSQIKQYRNSLPHFNADFVEDFTIVANNIIHVIKGSLAYSWDYGDIHFIQLHNYPSYHVSLKEEHTEVHITKSLDWLKKDLESADERGQVSVINFHDGRPASIDGESFFIHKKNAKDLALFKSMITKHNVKAIFVGHTHYQSYCRAKDDKVFGNVPLYTAGALFNGDYYHLEVKEKDIYVKAYNGEVGKPLLIRDLGIIGGDTEFSPNCSNL